MYRLHVGLLTCWLYCYENGWWHIGPKPWIAPSATLVWVKALWTPKKWDGGLLQKQSMRRSTRAPRIVLKGIFAKALWDSCLVPQWMYLVGGLDPFLIFHILGIIIPTVLIFFRGVWNPWYAFVHYLPKMIPKLQIPISSMLNSISNPHVFSGESFHIYFDQFMILKTESIIFQDNSNTSSYNFPF